MITEKNALQQLRLLREEFDAWRKSKAYRNEKIPDELWSKACELVPYIPLTRIVTSLKISLNALKKLAQEKGYEPKYSGHPASKKKPATAAEPITPPRTPEVTKFVLPANEPVPTEIHNLGPKSSKIHLSLTFPSGASASLEIPTGTDSQMVQTIMTCLGGLSHGGA